MYRWIRKSKMQRNTKKKQMLVSKVPQNCLIIENICWNYSHYVRGFADKRYNEAIELYTKAIDLNPNVAVYYGNRSFAYLKTECFGYALNDATKAIELDKNYLKGYYRRAASHMALGKFKLALRDFEAVIIRTSSKIVSRYVVNTFTSLCRFVKRNPRIKMPKRNSQNVLE